VPVVTSKTTSLPEVAGNAAALVDPENPEDIAQCVEKLYRKPALRKALIVKGLARAKQFTWEKTAQLTLPVYQRMGPREKKD
jgi:glycosyltransferase involved in cell wall biosynthesis